MPEYVFSISDNSENITSLETAPPNMALACVPSTLITNSQNVLPILAETSLSTLSTVLRPDTSHKEITSSRFLNKSIPVTKIEKIFN